LVFCDPNDISAKLPVEREGMRTAGWGWMENVGSSDALDADLLSVLPDIFLKTLEKNEGIKGQGMKIGYVRDCVYLCESSGCTYRVVVVGSELSMR
jgi:hypothetical protein